MGITEDRNTKQIHFCHMCGGPGTQRLDATRRICYGCKRLYQSWQIQVPIRPKRVKRLGSPETYKLRRAQFLQENPFCWVALIVFKRLETSNTVHHRKGRGRHYIDTETWLATTKEGDKWIHQNKEASRKLGFLLL